MADAQGVSFLLAQDSLGVDVTYSSLPTWGAGLTVKDYNNDGWDDLVICTDPSEPVRVFENQYGIFQEVDLGVFSAAYDRFALWVDYDNDGTSELFHITYSSGVYMYDIDSNGSWVDVTASIGLGGLGGNVRSGALFADFNNDGLLDLSLASHNQVIPNSLFFQTPNHSFHNVSTLSGACDSLDFTFFAAAIDYNNDGWMDFYEANDAMTGNLLFHNNGDSTFTEVSHLTGTYHELNAMGLGIGDFDGDTDLDIHVTGHVNETILLRNEGNGNFTEVGAQYNADYSTGIGWGNTFFDAEMDGDNDLYVSGIYIPFQGSAPSILHVNDGSGYFTLDTLENDSFYSFSNAVFDLNNDRMFDIASLNSGNNPSSIWLNTSDPANPRFSIKLEGCTSNRDAVGAKLIAYDGPDTRLWMHHSVQSFMSQNSDQHIIPIVNGQVLDSLKIIWPLGNDTMLYSIQGNQSIRLSECGSAKPYPVILVDDYDDHGLVLCSGSSITLRVNGEYDAIQWSNGATTDSILVTSPGVYDVTVSNQFGQSSASTKAVAITSKDYPVYAAEVGQPDCFNDGFIHIIYPQQEDYDFTWSHGSSSDSIFGLTPGTYTMTVTNDGHCPLFESFTLSGPDSLSPISIDLITPPIPCAGDSVLVVANGSGGYGPFTYEWSNGSAGPEQRFGAGAYQLTLTDPNGCARDTAFRLSEPEPVFVWAESLPDTNLEGVGKAWIEIDGGTRPYAIQWNDRQEQTTDTAFNLYAGDYIASVVDRNACRYQRQVEVRNRITLGATRAHATAFKCLEQNGSVLLETDVKQGIEPSSIRVIDVLGRHIDHQITYLGEGDFLLHVPNQGVSIIHVNDQFACKVLR